MLIFLFWPEVAAAAAKAAGVERVVSETACGLERVLQEARASERAVAKNAVRGDERRDDMGAGGDSAPVLVGCEPGKWI